MNGRSRVSEDLAGSVSGGIKMDTGVDEQFPICSWPPDRQQEDLDVYRETLQTT